ncbi:hypothetical protein F4860DRAFT_481243 [Xylaria cubensis]|nr:hypothetical protein F4860DRAFT_481243 [Xylaria cubensis]
MSDNYATQQSEGGKAGGQEGSHSADHGIAGPSFDRIYEQKRSTDTMSKEKRENLADQKPQGIIGKMWQSAMSGPGGPNTNGGEK